MPILLNQLLCMAGVVESWAAGNSWAQVIKDCSLDDGDVARLLSRTADLLKQTAHCPSLLSPLQTTARRAVKAMTRKPIRELLI
jgi:superfamily II RNA helicase